MSDGYTSFWKSVFPSVFEEVKREIENEKPDPPPKPPPLKPSYYSTFDTMPKTSETKPLTTGSIHVQDPGPCYIGHKLDGLNELTKAILVLKETMDRVETRLANIQADLEFNGFPEIKK